MRQTKSYDKCSWHSKRDDVIPEKVGSREQSTGGEDGRFELVWCWAPPDKVDDDDGSCGNSDLGRPYYVDPHARSAQGSEYGIQCSYYVRVRHQSPRVAGQERVRECGPGLCSDDERSSGAEGEYTYNRPGDDAPAPREDEHPEDDPSADAFDGRQPDESQRVR